MADFLLYVFKLNVLAALLIVLVFGVSRFLSKKYSVWWRSWIWLAVSLILLVPVQIPDYWNVIHIQIPQQVTEERVPAVREEVRVQAPVLFQVLALPLLTYRFLIPTGSHSRYSPLRYLPALFPNTRSSHS